MQTVFRSLAAAAMFALSGAAGAASAATEAPRAASEFAGIDNWLNSGPLTMAQLRGKAVLVDFWTYDCINCQHTLPQVKAWYAKYKDKGLVVVGVHTPEYGFERNLDNLKTAVKRNGIDYPVAQDNRYATWQAWGNQFWPAFYVVDRKGQVVFSQFGEGNYERTDAAIRKALGL
jgi:thiol-disulfide isomerase/thioredoxin